MGDKEEKHLFDCLTPLLGNPTERGADSCSTTAQLKQMIDSGSTWADHVEDHEMGGGGALASPMPGGAGADATNMPRLRLTRAKGSYGIIVRHISDKDVRDIISTNHFQDGRVAFNFSTQLMIHQCCALIYATWTSCGTAQA